jgi:hypothetical protein
MWLCYLRFEDQGQTVVYLLDCGTQASVSAFVNRAEQHGLTPCECLVRRDIGPPSRERPEEDGKEIIHVRVLKQVQGQSPEGTLSALLANVW